MMVLPPWGGRKGVKKMENIEIAYVDYSGRVQVSLDALIVALWNTHVEYVGGENKISLNNKEFFENAFDNAYDAAMAVSLSGAWTWSDDYVYFDDEGYLTSFCHWNDETSPIDLDKLDISRLIDGLKKWHKNKKEYAVNNISRAIHDALENV